LSGQYPAPPYSLKYVLYKNIIRASVQLPRIPEQYINFDPTTTHFHVDTLKWSKKYFLHVPYPDGIKVNTFNPVANLEYGTLSIELPVNYLPPEIAQRRPKVLEEGKKRKEAKAKTKPSEKDESMNRIVQEIKLRAKENEKEKISEMAQTQTLAKGKRKLAEIQPSDQAEKKKNKKEGQQLSEKKNKKLPNKVETLQILAHVATAQERQRRDKLKKAIEKDNAQRKQQLQKVAQKQKKKKPTNDLRNEIISKLRNPQPTPKQIESTNNSSSKQRRVSFQI
jgi:hypothetical protein